jgi:hypothetical protein
MTSISVAAEECAAFGQRQQVVESFPGRDTNLGDLKILRALPIKGKRLVGPWCFLDRYGPYTFTEGKPMDLATRNSSCFSGRRRSLSGNSRKELDGGRDAPANKTAA